MKILFPNPNPFNDAMLNSIKLDGHLLDFLVCANRGISRGWNITDQNVHIINTDDQYAEILDNLCKDNFYDYIFPNFLDDHILSVATVNEKYNLLGIDTKTAFLLNDKSTYYNEFNNLGLPIPKIYKKIKQNDFNIDSSDITYPCVVKPTIGTGSDGVRLIHNEKELKLFFAKFEIAEHFNVKGRKLGCEYLIQQYVTGKVYCPMGHVSDGIFYTDFWQEISSGSGPFLPEKVLSMPVELDKKVMQLIEKDIEIFCKKIFLNNSPWRCEVIVNDNGYYFIDFGARIGGPNNQLLLEHSGEKNYYSKIINSIIYKNYQSIDIKNYAILSELGIKSKQFKQINCSTADDACLLYLPNNKVDESKTDADVFDNGFAVIKADSYENCKNKLHNIKNNIEIL